MLDFNRAKSLRDAGFETPIVGEQWFRARKGAQLKQSGAVNIATNEETGEDVEVPTLEDLIEFVDGEEMIGMYESLYVELALKKLLDKGQQSV